MDFIVERALADRDDNVVPHDLSDRKNDAELKSLLKSLQPKIRVFGCGGCGSNTVARLELEGVFDGTYVRGLAVNTDAPETSSRVRSTVKRKRWTMPVLLDSAGTASNLMNPRGNIPFSIFLDRKHRVAYSHESYKSGDEAKYKKVITDL
jgi:hypothetical protein